MKAHMLLAVAALLPMASLAQPAAAADCDPDALLAPAKENMFSDSRSSLAIASLFDSDLITTSDVNKAFGVNYAGVGVTFGDDTANSMRNKIRERLNLAYDKSDQRAYMSSFLKGDQLKAYVECRRITNPGVAVAQVTWTDTLSVPVAGRQRTRNITVTVWFRGNPLIPQYKMELMRDGKLVTVKHGDKLVPAGPSGGIWGPGANSWAYTFQTANINDPIDFIVNFTSVGRLKGNLATHAVSIPPVMPQVKVVLSNPLDRRSTEFGVECKTPERVDVPLNTAVSSGTVGYFTSAVGVETARLGDAAGNSGVVANVNPGAQSFKTVVTCQGSKANGESQVNGYGIGKEVTMSFVVRR